MKVQAPKVETFFIFQTTSFVKLHALLQSILKSLKVLIAIVLNLLMQDGSEIQ